MKKRTAQLIIVAFAILSAIGLAIFGYLTISETRLTPMNYLMRSTYIIIGIATALISVISASKLHKEQKALQRTLYFAGFGYAVWEGAGITFTLLNFIRNQQATTLEIELTYIIAFLVFGITAFFLFKHTIVNIETEHIVEALTIFLILSTIIALPLFRLNIIDSNDPLRFTHYFFYLSGALIAGLLIVLMRHLSKKLQPYHYFFMASVAIVTIADIIRPIEIQRGTIWNGNEIDALLLLAHFLLSTGLILMIQENVPEAKSKAKN